MYKLDMEDIRCMITKCPGIINVGSAQIEKFIK